SLQLCTAEAIRWVRTQPAESPILCYMPYHAVHTPLAEKDQRWFDLNGHIRDPDRRHFAAYLSHLDDAVGRLVEAFREANRYENTLIVFTSDNGGVEGGYKGGAYPEPDPKLKAGYSSNQPLRGGKSTSYEGGIRVPAFVHWKKGLTPGKLDAPMHAVDWFPTIREFAGIAPPRREELDGQSMAGSLTSPAQSAPPRTIYTTWNRGRQVALRHGNWKIRAAGPGKGNFKAFDWELYNLGEDPHETTNLADQNSGKLRELIAMFESERARDGILSER
nr:sulfatase-like hydrolase/transferase [Akkermansiaceae bacterium]